MLASKKTKGFFAEVSRHSNLLARTSTRSAPLVVEELKFCSTDKVNAVGDALAEMQPKRSGGQNFVRATCGVYSANRLVRHLALEPRRYKDPAYINEVITTQLRIEPEKYTLAVVNANDGTDFDFGTSNKKEAVFAGLLSDEIVELQNKLLEQGLYPERLELGTLATLGGLVDYHVFKDIKTPTLVLEIDTDGTQSHILSSSGVEASRPITQGLEAMIPVVQKEIGLKDEDAARRLFYSNAFDFTGMGPSLIKKLIKELQSSIGFYEVQTGQSIGQVVCTLLPPKLGWLEGVIAQQLGVTPLGVEYKPWLESRGITFAEGVATDGLDTRWVGLFSLMLNHNHAVAAQKES